MARATVSVNEVQTQVVNASIVLQHLEALCRMPHSGGSLPELVLDHATNLTPIEAVPGPSGISAIGAMLGFTFAQVKV